MEEEELLEPLNKRPFFLSILCVAVFVYSAVFILVFSSVALFNNWFRFVLAEFLSVTDVNRTSIIFLSIAGILLYGLSFISALLIWKMKRAGLYLYIAATIIIACIPFLFGLGSLLNLVIFFLLILSFAFFFRKLT